MTCLPTTLLLGMPKSGTTWLHNCLLEKASVRPCCHIKEPATFLRKPVPKFPTNWPQNCTETTILDFTTNYMSFSNIVIPNILSTYRNYKKRIHFIFVTREPVSRSFSHYCMFIPSAISMKQICMSKKYHTSWEGVCMRYSVYFKGENTTIQEWKNILYERYPKINRNCKPGGWGRIRTNRNFEDELFAQYNYLYNRPYCNIDPHRAVHMTIHQLKEYHSKCLSKLTTNELFIESVPVFQMAYYHKSFPNARWTFVNYEDLFKNDTLHKIFGEIGLKQKSTCNKKKINGFSSITPIHTKRVYKLFKNWSNALHLLKMHIKENEKSLTRKQESL